MGFLDLFKDIRFLAKFICMLLNIVALIVWVLDDYNEGAKGNNSSRILFAHTVPAYMIILITIVILFLISEEPGPWFLRFFIGAGAILFLISGIMIFVNCDSDAESIIIAILSLVICAGFVVDILKTEKVF